MEFVKCLKHNLYNCSHCHTNKNIKKTWSLHGIVKCQKRQCRQPTRLEIIWGNVLIWLFPKY